MDEVELTNLYNSLTNAGNYPVSSNDIRNILNTRIVQYNDIKKLRSIEEILPKRKDAVILFLANAGSDIGHWVGLLKYDDVIEFFDSYGKNPPNNDIYNLVKKSNYRLVINNVRYQQLPMTCGFHAMFRIFTMLYKNMNLNDYQNFMRSPADHDRAILFYMSFLINNN